MTIVIDSLFWAEFYIAIINMVLFDPNSDEMAHCSD